MADATHIQKNGPPPLPPPLYEEREWGVCISREFFTQISFLTWIIALGGFAALIVFLTPSWYWPNNDSANGINVSPLVLNVIGSFVIAICTSFAKVKYQYYQTYIMYAAIKGGFCSAFTTYGNLIADTGRLLLVGHWGLSLLNFVGTLFLSIIAYQLGSFVAYKWKSGVKLSEEVILLGNEQNRMGYELDKQLAQSDPSNLSGSIDVHHKSRFRRASLKRFEEHMEEQLSKMRAHRSVTCTTRHSIIIYVLLLSVTLAFFAFAILVLFDVQRHLPAAFLGSDPHLVFDYTITIVFSITGALIGGWVGDKYNMSDKVQWGTFRVNLISCVFIAMAHNLAMFKAYFPGEDKSYFNLVLYRFVTSFCGSESSFAGLIDETMILWNGNTSKRRWNAAWNIFFGLVVCLVVFFLLILSVRIGMFFRYWSPQTARLYLCSGGFFFTC